MNKQPVYYMQTDPRWKNLPYRVKGESSTIGGSGCGPSCAAMLIETLTGKTFTPKDACDWSIAHGYKALNQGTYYAYFKQQFAAFGIQADMLNGSSLYGNPSSTYHDKALQMLKEGYYIIACMGKGLWTSSGHFIVVWWEDGLVRINDPASKVSSRLNGDLKTFKSQVKFYFWVDARKYNKGEDGIDMTVNEFIDSLTNEQAYTLVEKAQAHAKTMKASDYAEKPLEWAEEKGIMKGTEKGNLMPKAFITREDFITALNRFDGLEE